MPDAVQLLVQISLGLLLFGVGLQSRRQDLAFVWQHPGLLLSGVLSANVVVPCVAVILVLLLPIAPVTRAGLVAMAFAPMAPFLPGKLLKMGAAPEVAVGLYFSLAVVSVVIVPASIWLIAQITDRELVMPVSTLAVFVLTSVLIPLLCGTLAAGLWPKLAKPAAKYATLAAYVGLLPIIVVILVKSAGGIAELVGDGTLLAIALTVAAGISAGHFLGGPEPANRVALAHASVTRHPGIAAMVIQTNGVDNRAMLAVVLFLLTSIVISALYTKLMSARIVAALLVAVPKASRT